MVTSSLSQADMAFSTLTCEAAHRHHVHADHGEDQAADQRERHVADQVALAAVGLALDRRAAALGRDGVGLDLGAQDVGDLLRALRRLLAQALVLVGLGLDLGLHVRLGLGLALDLGALGHVVLELGLHLGAGVDLDALARLGFRPRALLGLFLGLALGIEIRGHRALALVALLALDLGARLGLVLGLALGLYLRLGLGLHAGALVGLLAHARIGLRLHASARLGFLLGPGFRGNDRLARLRLGVLPGLGSGRFGVLPGLRSGRFGVRPHARFELLRLARLFLGLGAQLLGLFLGADARLGFRLGAGLGLGALLRLHLGASAGLALGLRGDLGLGLGDHLALLAQALLELGLRRELRLGHDLGLHLRAGLFLDLVAQQVFHLLADARLDLFLELGLHLGLGRLGVGLLLLRGGLGLDARLGHRRGLGLGSGTRLGERLGLALGPHAQLGELAALFLFLRLLLEGLARLLFGQGLLLRLALADLGFQLGSRALVRLLLGASAQLGHALRLFLFLRLLLGNQLRLLRRERLLARLFLAHLLLELGLGAFGGFLRALGLLHRGLLGLLAGLRLGIRARARFGLRLGLEASLLVGGFLRLAVGLALGLLRRERADVVGRRRDDALRRAGHRAFFRRGEVEVVVATLGERVELLLLGLEDAGEAVLGEGVQRALEDVLVELGLLDQLPEIGLAVDELEDLHQVLRKRGGFLVDLRDAFRGLRENGCLIHPTPRSGFFYAWFRGQ
jgi:hypothetical protein